jgi:PAS domain S-box-containing protein
MPRPRILAVDDDERNLFAIREVLAGTGDVVCAQSGEEALRFLLKEEYAVILLDVLMPGLDGYETAALVRQREQSKSTPIIFLTAINKEDAHMLRGYDAGAVDYVFKPFDPVMLRSKVSVFVELYEKTKQIEQKAVREQKLLEEALKSQSEKLEAIRELRRSEERQKAILDSLPVCFHARETVAPFAAHYVSKGVEKVTGFSPERLLSDPHFGLSRVHPDDLVRLRQALEGAKETGSYSCEFRWQCADGQYRCLLDQGVYSPAGQGGAPELLGTMLDVSEQRRLEDQLLQSRRMDAIGQLTGGLAHDFNNLLAAILSGLSLLERSMTEDERAGQLIEMMRRSARQGADLVNRMLAFSRRQNLQPVTLRLTSLGETMMGLVAPILGGFVRFEWQVDDTVWPVHVDAGQLELALMNLIFNARDAMPCGGTITIRADNHTVQSEGSDLSSGAYVVISVEDTGSGIPAEILAKVVEPFFTTKPAGKGTGLGLSTVFGFANQSGGTLRINSTPDRGTVVELWLPRSQEALEAAPVSRKQMVDEIRGETGRELPSVLLIDDSSSLLELTAESLRQYGFKVTTAAGGAEALAAIEREPDRFDIIVTDFAMPMISGLDVIRFARNLRSGWPAVIITGYANAGALAEGPDDVPLVTKPFDEQDLIETIRSTAGRTSR